MMTDFYNIWHTLYWVSNIAVIDLATSPTSSCKQFCKQNQLSSLIYFTTWNHTGWFRKKVFLVHHNNTAIQDKVDSFQQNICRASKIEYSITKYSSQNSSQNLHILRLQAAIISQWLQIAGNLLPNWPSTGCLVSIFTVRINSKSFSWAVRSVKETYLPKFSDVRYCVLKPIVRRSADAAWRPIYEKSRLNWKLKISNATDNADITQSQARETRHRRKQEVNSLCTDSWPLRANTVLRHSTQYSLLVNYILLILFCCRSVKYFLKADVQTLNAQ